MGNIELKVWMGKTEAAKRIKKAMQDEAKKTRAGNPSRLLIWDFCEKYGYDPLTGQPLSKPDVKRTP